MQRRDFIELFEIMAGLPVTIRLLDPPLHDSCPNPSMKFSSSPTISIAPDICAPVSASCRSSTHAGPSPAAPCRVYPEIARCRPAHFRPPPMWPEIWQGADPEIMIPLVVGKLEFDYVRAPSMRLPRSGATGIRPRGFLSRGHHD
jgi:pyruvate,orthophosphate dikinase